MPALGDAGIVTVLNSQVSATLIVKELRYSRLKPEFATLNPEDGMRADESEALRLEQELRKARAA